MKDIEQYLEDKYEFYFNVFSNKTYYKAKNSNEQFAPLDDYFLNSLCREIKHEKMKVSLIDLKMILHSNFVKLKNPFTNYLDNIKGFDPETDYIEQISSTVKTNDNDYFKWVLKKWLVGLVACVVNSKIAHENVLIFIGKQGVGKTTWLRSLLPDALSEYYYSGEFNPNNKDHLALFTSKILINLDELTSFTASRTEQFKELLSKRTVTFRRPYGTYNEDIPRIASMVGTSNHKDILMDTSGNRRFLCIEVLELNTIDSDTLSKAYKQAFELYKQDFKFYYTTAEEAIVNTANIDFMQINEETDVITKYFETCDVYDEEALFMNATEIIDYVKVNYKHQMKTNSLKLGRLLNNYGFHQKKSNGVKRYALKLKDIISKNVTQDPLNKYDIYDQEIDLYGEFIDLEEYLTEEHIIAIDRMNYPPDRVKEELARMDKKDKLRKNRL